MQGTQITISGQRAKLDFEALGGVCARSWYIHVPFCFHKCHYCDFYSFVDTRDRQEEFLKILLKEISFWAKHASKPLKTVFVGGGTPTLLKVPLWEQLLAHMAQLELIGPATEFTVECNPETASEELFSSLRKGGVNRLSFGAQSFNETHLKTLERWHDPKSVPRAIELARQAGINRQSVDLIFAIPGQTLEEWEADVARALELGVEHVSAYALTYELGTAMTKRLELGQFEPADEDLEADMFVRTREVMKAAGLEAYEVSNFAVPGQECQHNLVYWRQEDWLASGPSASGHLAGRRWKNVPRLTDWMESVERSGSYSAMVDVELPDAKRAIAEWIMTGLRLREGLKESELCAKLNALHGNAGSASDRDACSLPPRGRVGEGVPVEPDASPTLSGESTVAPDTFNQTLQQHINTGNIRVTNDRITLTDAGVLLADGICSELMGAIGES